MAKERPEKQQEINVLLQRIHALYGYGVVMSFCLVCEQPYDVKPGGETAGISDGLCNTCFNKVRKSAINISA